MGEGLLNQIENCDLWHETTMAHDQSTTRLFKVP